ncbi:MAG: fumarate reductase cytochrome b subunit [Candidatus Krumholzibacteria bacterium]|nr:fumarate reductase cytochrome b subunit [Candidatus Krumholzibacteria bacterium]
MKDLVESVRSPVPAWLDVTQSVTGLVLAVFMWIHLFLVSSILLGKDAMYYVTGFFELRFLTDWQHGYPVLVSIIAIGVFAIFILHAGIALRKFPVSWRQHRIIRDQMRTMKHSDTNLWYYQAITGFVMFFLGSVHIYVMASHPDKIGPYASSDRFVSEHFWPLYLVLLVAVELHATIGMYRLAVKWITFGGKDPRRTRKRLKVLKNALTVFFLTVGAATFVTYMKIGLEHRDQAGERYSPATRHSSVQSQQVGDE